LFGGAIIIFDLFCQLEVLERKGAAETAEEARRTERRTEEIVNFMIG